MRIDILEAETMEYKNSLSEEELFNKCGRDKRMFSDIIRHIKSHPYIKSLNEYWVYVNEY